jgi:hypothetical protein
LFLQYAAETKSPGLLAAQDAILKDEAAEWKRWFNEEIGPALPPGSSSLCSVFEKLVIVQLYVAVRCHLCYGCVNVCSRLRPDKFAAAAYASVASAHPSVDTTNLVNPNGFNIAAAFAASCTSRVILVIQHDNADSFGDIFAYSSKEFGYGPLVLSSYSRLSTEDVSEYHRAQRVGGWVVVQVPENANFNDMRWLNDLMPGDVSIVESAEDYRRPTTHSQFRLWIISCSTEAVPPNVLEGSHIVIHESHTRTFAATATAAVEAAASIREELSPHCTSAQRASVAATALIHALFCFKHSCSASLSRANYDAFPSLPALRVQISHLLAFSRACAGLNTQAPASQRGRARTPSSPAAHNALSSATAATAGRSDSDDRTFIQLLSGGCGLLVGVYGRNERKRFKSLAENVFGCMSGAGFTAANIAASLSLPVPLIAAADAVDSTAVANVLPFEDEFCSVLGPDVQRVLALQQSFCLAADIVMLSSPWLRTAPRHDIQFGLLQLQHSESFMSCVEHGAPCRLNVPEDFWWHDQEAPNDAQSEPEFATKPKNAASADGKMPPTSIVHPSRPPANAVLLSVYEVLLSLPDDIGVAAVFAYYGACSGLSILQILIWFWMRFATTLRNSYNETQQRLKLPL